MIHPSGAQTAIKCIFSYYNPTLELIAIIISCRWQDLTLPVPVTHLCHSFLTQQPSGGLYRPAMPFSTISTSSWTMQLVPLYLWKISCEKNFTIHELLPQDRPMCCNNNRLPEVEGNSSCLFMIYGSYETQLPNFYCTWFSGMCTVTLQTCFCFCFIFTCNMLIYNSYLYCQLFIYLFISQVNI